MVIRSQPYVCLLSPTGLIRVLTLATSVSHSFFMAWMPWCLLALTFTMNMSVLLSSIFFRADSGQGELDDGILVKFISPPLRVFALLPQAQCLELLEGGWRVDLLDAFQHHLLGFQAFIGFGFRGAGAYFFAFSTILVKRRIRLFSFFWLFWEVSSS